MQWINHAEWIITMCTLLGCMYLHRQDMLQQSVRTDKLYELYVEAKASSDQKFYDMLKAGCEIQYVPMSAPGVGG